MGQTVSKEKENKRAKRKKGWIPRSQLTASKDQTDKKSGDNNVRNT
jgi:hypothetical protein